ncbi:MULTISPECIES: sensor histidine kinase [unclassified Paenibacillus]|uniref:sensor histidine kinase n=1 Tax=unclassified Paenibacillus TaxID=185978 RepID=UPI000955EB79|nr:MULTISPECIES: sensor histidine kinase [unclassified Paenibacillus]ASS68699.1 sensor histidine kinase [Paenibacillus sp. RUD330]SIR56013.1 two-component system, NarL family, sensor histidine kinase DesK [Paenibacillus sp. RU4X]SIR64542.1 two-component system, NarL family, sensor histidine kinase DesK [Paenibacillus sp. RU4T]
MQKWYRIFPRSSGFSLYVWLAFIILPFYFIFRFPETRHMLFGGFLVALFFLCFRLTSSDRGWRLYTGISIQMAVSAAMTIYFHYPYFSFFLAVFIGNTRSWAGFLSLYIVHLVVTLGAVYTGFAIGNEFFISQWPFVLVCLIGVAVLPFNRYNTLKQVKLQGQLEDANRRIADLLVHEERQRIALDLHDTLGQQLSLIRLKSDLAGKLLDKDPERARGEMADVHQTARIALQEVREMVSHMRGARLEDEIQRIRQILGAAEISFEMEGDPRLAHTSRLTENVLSMCIKEAVTNVVKHSHAASCSLSITQLPELLIVKVKDDGNGIRNVRKLERGNGLQGMKERLEFLNGTLEISGAPGTEITMTVPHNVSRVEKEVEA